MVLQRVDAGEICNVVQSIIQTLSCGVFIHLLALTIFVFTKQGFNKRGSAIILTATIVAFWIFLGGLLAGVAALMTQFTETALAPLPLIIDVRDTFKAVAHLNLLFADGVVIWRMYVLCSNDYSKLVLLLPAVFFAITSVSAGTLVSLRIYSAYFPNESIRRQSLENMINVAQMTCRVFSLVANLTATSIMSLWIWLYRRKIQRTIRLEDSTRRLERIVILFLESGAIFCVSSTFFLFSSIIELPLISPLGPLLQGMYPALVMIMVYSRANSSLEAVSHGTLVYISKPNDASIAAPQRPSHGTWQSQLSSKESDTSPNIRN